MDAALAVRARRGLKEGGLKPALYTGLYGASVSV